MYEMFRKIKTQKRKHTNFFKKEKKKKLRERVVESWTEETNTWNDGLIKGPLQKQIGRVNDENFGGWERAYDLTSAINKKEGTSARLWVEEEFKPETDRGERIFSRKNKSTS